MPRVNTTPEDYGEIPNENLAPAMADTVSLLRGYISSMPNIASEVETVNSYTPRQSPLARLYERQIQLEQEAREHRAAERARQRSEAYSWYNSIYDEPWGTVRHHKSTFPQKYTNPDLEEDTHRNQYVSKNMRRDNSTGELKYLVGNEVIAIQKPDGQLRINLSVLEDKLANYKYISEDEKFVLKMIKGMHDARQGS